MNSILKPWTLLVAVLLSSTALYSAFVAGTMPVSTALTRFLIALPVAAVMVFLFTTVTASYRAEEKPAAEETHEEPLV